MGETAGEPLLNRSTRWTFAAVIAATEVATFMPAGASAATTNLTAKDNGRSIVVYPGDQIALKLQSCEASCGYSWSTTTAPKSSIVTTGASTIAGQVRTFNYTARKSGDTSLRLSYDPPGTAKATDHFAITIHVKRSFNLVQRDGQRKGIVYLAAPGDRLVIKLRSCEGSCGYSWHTIDGPDHGILRKTSSRLEGNYRTFVYTAVGRGTTTLGLGYQPPGSKRAAKKFAITL
jgi:predicted secreted protein